MVLIVVLLALLAGLYVAGRAIAPDASTPAEATATAAPAAPVAASPVRPWSTLTGGECLVLYSSPQDALAAVVGCATPHAAQLYAVVPLGGAKKAYPGAAVIRQEATLLCQKPALLRRAAASAIADLRIEVGYPKTRAAWEAGERSLDCVATRAGGGTLTGSLARP